MQHVELCSHAEFEYVSKSDVLILINVGFE